MHRGASPACLQGFCHFEGGRSLVEIQPADALPDDGAAGDLCDTSVGESLRHLLPATPSAVDAFGPFRPRVGEIFTGGRQAGTPIHHVARRLGHRDATVTLSVYAHVIDDQADDGAAAAYGHAIGAHADSDADSGGLAEVVTLRR